MLVAQRGQFFTKNGRLRWRSSFSKFKWPCERFNEHSPLNLRCLAFVRYAASSTFNLNKIPTFSSTNNRSIFFQFVRLRFSLKGIRRSRFQLTTERIKQINCFATVNVVEKSGARVRTKFRAFAGTMSRAFKLDLVLLRVQSTDSSVRKKLESSKVPTSSSFREIRTF